MTTEVTHRASHVQRALQVEDSFIIQIDGVALNADPPTAPRKVGGRNVASMRVGFARMPKKDREMVEQMIRGEGLMAWLLYNIGKFMSSYEWYDHVEVAFRAGDLTKASIERYQEYRVRELTERGGHMEEQLYADDLIVCRTLEKRCVEVLPRKFERVDHATGSHVYNSKYEWYGIECTPTQLNSAFTYCLDVCGVPHGVSMFINPLVFPRTDDLPTTCASLSAYALRRIGVGNWRHAQTLSVDDIYAIVTSPEVTVRHSTSEFPALQRALHESELRAAEEMMGMGGRAPRRTPRSTTMAKPRQTGRRK